MNVHGSISSIMGLYVRVHVYFFVIHFLCPFITGIQNATYPCIADERNCRKLKTKKNVSHQFVSKVLSELENILRQTKRMTVTVVIRITTTAILFRSYLSVNSNHQKRMSILLIPKGGMISEQFALMSSVEIFVDCIADMVNDQYFRIIGDDTFSDLCILTRHELT